MPFSPSDFEWWMWALFAAGFLLVCIVCCFVADASKHSAVAVLFGLMAVVLGVGFFGCAVVALVLFAKWLLVEFYVTRGALNK